MPSGISGIPGEGLRKRLFDGNNRYSLFVGGGQGGEEWGGKAELVKPTKDDKDASLRRGEAAGRLRSVLRDERPRAVL